MPKQDSKIKSDPNIKTFPFVVDWIDDILKHIDGYMDNKKLLCAVALKRLYDDFQKVDLRKNDDVEKFVLKIIFFSTSTVLFSDSLIVRTSE